MEEQVTVGQLQHQLHKLRERLDTLAVPTDAGGTSGRSASAVLISQLQAVQSQAAPVPSQAHGTAAAPTPATQVG